MRQVAWNNASRACLDFLEKVMTKEKTQGDELAPRFGIAKDEGLFLRQVKHPWQATVMPDFGENFAEAAHKRVF